MASLLGLSSAIFTKIYSAFFNPDIPRFLLFMAGSIAGFSLLGFLFVSYTHVLFVDQGIS
jgi:hypothetical protein